MHTHQPPTLSGDPVFNIVHAIFNRKKYAPKLGVFKLGPRAHKGELGVRGKNKKKKNKIKQN